MIEKEKIQKIIRVICSKRKFNRDGLILKYNGKPF